MQVKPLAAGLEKRLAFCQLRLATLPIVVPGHGFRAQQQMQVVVPYLQCLLDPHRASAKQGAAPKDVAQQMRIENQQGRLLGPRLIFPRQLAKCYRCDVFVAGYSGFLFDEMPNVLADQYAAEIGVNLV
ncbi:hypothetical protein D3C84_617740 [compost metagenome]